MRFGNLVFRSAMLFSLATASAHAATHNIDVALGGSDVLTFTPSSISIPSGDTITFTNSNVGGGQFLHNAVSDDGGATFSTGVVAAGPWTFITGPITSSIAYHCTNHGTAGPGGGVPGTGMAGSITVQAVPVKLQSFDVH
jgi:plastocyanin